MSMRILLVEDDGFHQAMMGEALRERWPDCQIRTAGTCADALQRAREEVYDAFILDLMLPDGDAMEVLRRLRSDGVPGPVIVVTGQGDELVAVHAMKEGVSDYIIKRGEYWDLVPRSLEASLRTSLSGLAPSAEATGRFRAIDASRAAQAAPEIDAHRDASLSQELSDERSARWSLEKELRHRTEFVANVSHDLRTPLTAVKNSLEILQSDLDPGLSREVRHFLDVARRGADRLAQILDDLLDMSRLEAGRFDLRLEPLDLDTLCRNVAAELKAMAEQSNVELRYSCEVPAAIAYADPGRVREVMRTLLSQAIRSSPEWTAVVVTLDEPGQETTVAGIGGARKRPLRVTVRDAAATMSAVDQETLFDRYVPGQAPSEGGRKGAGLSLPLTRELVLAHSGQIHAEAAAGGNQIIFTLPAHSEDTVLLLEFEAEKKKARRQFSSVSLILFRLLNVEQCFGSPSVDPRSAEATALLTTLAREIRAGTGKALWWQGKLPTLAVLAAAGREGALVLANRLRRALCSRGAAGLGLDRPLYLEFGVSVYPEEFLEGPELIAAAAATSDGEFIIS